ncbi:MAG: DNA-directed RNA polymerase subunit beta', partial [Candidatus Schekmanbacteria bacterium]
ERYNLIMEGRWINEAGYEVCQLCGFEMQLHGNFIEEHIKEHGITVEEYRQQCCTPPENFEAGIGAEAIKKMLMQIDLEELAKELRTQFKTVKSVQTKRTILKRLKIVEAFRKSGNKPEWMILDVIPVIPPDLRPLVPLQGGRFATSDLNDLYRRVINRNNRLKRLRELEAPEVIIRNEKRMLQEAVDALFDNSKRGRALKGQNKRPLKSLSDMLKGKQGRFRQNLLGKRVDYSARSVIVVGPELKLNQCGIPKMMALELFKPFIYHKLEKKGLVGNIKTAKKKVERLKPEVWDILDEVIKEHPVLLNRAPTLHRLGIQAFDPVLTEGKAISIHPLVCAAYNADFDGDQMAVHLPLSNEAQLEARVLMMASQNILSPAHGNPLAVPSQDMVLGLYYMSKEKKGVKGEGMAFSSIDELKMAYDMGEVDIHAIVKTKVNGHTVSSVVGRFLLADILPSEIPFEYVDKEMKKKNIVELVEKCFRTVGLRRTVVFLDKLKELGFSFATKAGISFSIADLKIPRQKQKLLESAVNEVVKIDKEYKEGIITAGERYNKVVDTWSQTTDRVAEELLKELQEEDEKLKKDESATNEQFNPVYMMLDSGARGSANQIRQLAGMRGLMAKPSGEIIETPIQSNFKEGLSVLEYFISTHGARKGLADTALKTANSGYLTRRLVDVAQDLVVTEEDCGTIDGIEVEALMEGGEIIEPLSDRILGRTSLEDIKDPTTGEIIVKANEEINEEVVELIEDAGIDRVKIRSILTCDSKQGTCVKCYGRDLATGESIKIGDPIGIIAAQSIGEPGTQLTMRTFHIGGAVSGASTLSSRKAKNAGKVKLKNIKTYQNREGKEVVVSRKGVVVVDEGNNRVRNYPVEYGAHMKVKDGDDVEAGQILFEWDPHNKVIISEKNGKVKFGDIIEGQTIKQEVDEITAHTMRDVVDYKDESKEPRISIKDENNKTVARYQLPTGAYIEVEEGDYIKHGDIIAKIPRETTKTKDMTVGLPRVDELFEARKPKEQAIISEIDGIVELPREMVKGQRRVIIRPEKGKAKEYLIPRGKHILVQDGEFIKAGEALVDGLPNPHDILKVQGPHELQKFLVAQVQEVYRLQGVNINDKHIEVIVRQMLKKVKIKDPGDSEYIVGQQVDKIEVEEVNKKLRSEKKKPADWEPVLLGITKAALSTTSFVSAASFQETTRILTEAAINGKVDKLTGLKENVIMGKLIPAGTGLDAYRKVKIALDEEIA